MEIYYDPILGMCYDFVRPIFIVDIAVIPKGLDIDGFLKMLWEQPLLFVEKESGPGVDIVHNGIWSNF